MKHSSVRLIVLLVLEGILLSLVGLAFWLQYRRDNAIVETPSNLVVPCRGSRIFPDVLAQYANPSRPLVLAFVSPDCPCTRFNLQHLEHLIFTWKDRVDFLAIASVTTDQPHRDLQVSIPYLEDSAGELARLFGVHTTPRVVILDLDRRVYFHGNLNAGRYCNNRESEYVRLALEAFERSEPCPSFAPSATLAYGCRILSLHRPQP